MIAPLDGTACASCEHARNGDCQHPQRRRRVRQIPLALWLGFALRVPEQYRPRAPGWCPLRQHEQLALWRPRVARRVQG